MTDPRVMHNADSKAKKPSHAEFQTGFVFAALGIALTTGFGYAGFLAVLIGFDLPLGDWLVSTIQAHGHAQLRGWAGLFIVGISLHFLPRMTGKPLSFPRLLPWVCGLLFSGIALRGVAQPLLDVYADGLFRTAFRWGLGISVPIEAAGVGLYLFLLISTLRGFDSNKRADALRPVRPFMVTALLGWALSTLLVASLVLSAVADNRSTLNLGWNRYAANLFLGLVLLPLGMAFSVRTFPLYLRLPAARWPVHLIGVLYLCGLALEEVPEFLALIDILPSTGGGIGSALTGSGRLIKGSALIWFIWELDILLRRKDPWTVNRVGQPGPDRRKTRDNLPDYGEFGGFDRLLYGAYIYLFVGAGLDAGGGVTLLVKGVPPVHVDAVRHVYLVGFVSLLIFGMAPRMIPGFLHRKRLAFPGLVDGTFWLAHGAVLFRVLPLLLPTHLLWRFPNLGTISTYAFGFSGLLGWAAVALLACNLVATCRGTTK